MHIGSRIRTRIAAILVVIGLSLGVITFGAIQPVLAATDTCKTITVTSGPRSAECTPTYKFPSATTDPMSGYMAAYHPEWTSSASSSNGFTWSGTFNDPSQTWLGVGVELAVTALAPPFSLWLTITCQHRWYIDVNGNLYDYSDGGNC